ncbi:MAG: sugar phosphate isomerase/epimerase [Candidatus Poribacteria bacterium]|nr:sugar phosphate isomerase/epimerase [Candidatus Poribacteria bacterium]
MKLGINTFFIMKFGFEAGLKFCQDLGVKAVEVNATESDVKRYCDVDTLLADDGELHRWLDAYASYGLEIYSFAAHGAPLSPDKQIAAEYSHRFRQACKLMEKISVTRLVVVAGLPEGAEGDKTPNWIINTDQDVLSDALKWQWEKRLIPYWTEHGKIAADHGVTLCFEMQVIDMIHTPAKLKRLRDEIGPVVACNFDISHMWVQGIDPFEAMRYLGDLIQNVHLKDTLIHAPNARLRGLFDSTDSLYPEQRSWAFTLPGWGHDEQTWREVITTLRFLGYEGILSLEMESEYIEIEEGLKKTAAFIRSMVLEQPKGPSWWQANELHERWKAGQA